MYFLLRLYPVNSDRMFSSTKSLINLFAVEGEICKSSETSFEFIIGV